MMKAVIAGSRNCGKISDKSWDYQKLVSIIDKVVIENNLKITTVVSGNANGPDIAGEMWARQNGVGIEMFKPDWSKGRGAGFARNAEMAVVGDILIALYDGKSNGTKHMIEQMKKRNKPVYIEIVE
jgi:hypothetical protein